MTVRELIEKLSQCDDDIKDFEVSTICHVQVNLNTRLSARCLIVTIQDNADIDNKTLWLRAEQP